MIKKTYKKLLSEQKRIELRVLITKMLSVFYLGNHFYCVCCGKSFRKFWTTGRIKRPNALCPHCMSLERIRLMEYFILNEFEIDKKTGISVLHFAPEKCLFDKFIKRDIEYIDADLNPILARNVIDITHIPYNDDYFDLIICSHVLGHVPDEHKAITEMFRVLKPGGKAIVMTLIDLKSTQTFEDPKIISDYDRLMNYGEPDLCRLHGLDFDKRLIAGGFSVEVIDYRQHFTEFDQIKFALGNGERELIFYCSKQKQV